MMNYKPTNYTSLSPYLIVEDAERYIAFLKGLFMARELRRFHHPNGKIAHMEMKIDDSILMLSDSTDAFPPNLTVLHLYVSDAKAIYLKALELGCVAIEEPKERPGDPDIRGSFKDYSGNFWSVSTQK